MDKRSKGVSAWIIVLVVLALAAPAAAGYFWLKDSSDNTDTNKSTDTNQTKKDEDKNGTTKPQAVTGPLTIYYVAVADAGKSGKKIGCDDSLVAVTTESVTTTDTVKSAMQRLLANHEMYYGESGLYNALYQSDLTYVSSSVSGDTVHVTLTGTLAQSGECDSPRVQAQLEQTAIKAASGATKAKITLNGKDLSDVLSLK